MSEPKEKLLPCPMCGAFAYAQDQFRAVCSQCAVNGPIPSWNRRAPVAAAAKEVLPPEVAAPSALPPNTVTDNALADVIRFWDELTHAGHDPATLSVPISGALYDALDRLEVPTLPPRIIIGVDYGAEPSTTVARCSCGFVGTIEEVQSHTHATSPSEMEVRIAEIQKNRDYIGVHSWNRHVMKGEYLYGDGTQLGVQRLIDLVNDVPWLISTIRTLQEQLAEESDESELKGISLRGQYAESEKLHAELARLCAQLQAERESTAEQARIHAAVLVARRNAGIRMEELRAENELLRKALSFLGRDMSYVAANDGGWYWYHATNGRRIGKGDTLLMAIEAAIAGKGKG